MGLGIGLGVAAQRDVAQLLRALALRLALGHNLLHTSSRLVSRVTTPTRLRNDSLLESSCATVRKDVCTNASTCDPDGGNGLRSQTTAW